MLKRLRIQNVALITELEVEFGQGLNVLTGETGAGKSIIIGSLNFIVGSRIDKTVIRHGESVARVDAFFEIQGKEVILTRILSTSGKNECRINDGIVTAELLRNYALSLINIHGQHDTDILLKPKNHMAIFDDFSGVPVTTVRKRLETAQTQLQRLKDQLKIIGGDEEGRKRLMDIYEFQVREISVANLKEGDDTQIMERRNYVQNFEKITNALQKAGMLIEGDRGAGVAVRGVIQQLSSIATLDNRAEKLLETARSISTELGEMVRDMSNYADDMQFDPDELRKLDERADMIKMLKRKYGSTITEVLAFMENAKKQHEEIIKSGESFKQLNAEIALKEVEVQKITDELLKVRSSYATEMEQRVTAQLRDLGMPNAVFKIANLNVTDCEFYFSANSTQPPRPLSAIISGGEMSRFMLAIKMAGTTNAAPTLVFDEIDTGISGITAHKVAEKLAEISKRNQTICVTHLAQIADKAKQHLHVNKGVASEVGVRLLNEIDRKVELSRMMGGEEFIKKTTGAN